MISLICCNYTMLSRRIGAGPWEYHCLDCNKQITEKLDDSLSWALKAMLDGTYVQSELNKDIYKFCRTDYCLKWTNENREYSWFTASPQDMPESGYKELTGREYYRVKRENNESST